MTEAELRELIARAKDEQWEELDLAGMELEALPPEIGELTQLKRLVLGKYDPEKREYVGNRLTALPDELWELGNLQELWIAENRLTEIPSAFPRKFSHPKKKETGPTRNPSSTTTLPREIPTKPKPSTKPNSSSSVKGVPAKPALRTNSSTPITHCHRKPKTPPPKASTSANTKR